MANLMSWRSLFQVETAATTKARSPIEEHLVAGMINRDDAADRRCFRPGTSASRRTSDDKKSRSSPVDALDHHCRQFKKKSDLGHEASGADVREVYVLASVDVEY